MKIKTSILILVIFATSVFGGNVTIITHGWNSNASDTNGWVWDMAYSIGNYEKRIQEYGGNSAKTFYKMHFDNGVLKSDLMFGQVPINNPSGDIIVALDWNPYSGVPLLAITSTVTMSEYIARFLVSDNAFFGINGPITQFPIHLIGHSRGGSLVCEIGKRLAEYGIYVHHTTTIDPHPIFNDGFDGWRELLVSNGDMDGSATNGIGKNIIFADNYFQLDGPPEGVFVNGAANRNLSVELNSKIANLSTVLWHTLTHLWYHSTIEEPGLFLSHGDIRLYSTDRPKWFSESEKNGRNAGYYSSYRAGQSIDSFTIRGYHPDFLNSISYGTGNTYNNYRFQSIQRKYGNKAKNILCLESMNTNKVKYKNYQFGEPIEFIQTTRIGKEDLNYLLVYQADFPNSKPYEELPLHLFVDSDENIFNDVIEVEKVSVPSTGEWQMQRIVLNYSNIVSRLKPGIYRVGAIIGDGIDARHYYSNQRVFVEPDAKIDFKYISQTSNYGFILYGTSDREYVFQRSYDLKNWENISAGRFMKFEDGNPSGRDVVYSVGMGPQTYWRLSYK
jgi:hypothetical protein